MGNGFWPIPFTIGLLVALSMKGKYDTTVAILIAGVLELGMDFFEMKRFRSILSKSKKFQIKSPARQQPSTE